MPANQEPTDPLKVKLLVVNESQHVVTIEIHQRRAFDATMGTTGTEWFRAVVTFTLTEDDHLSA